MNGIRQYPPQTGVYKVEIKKGSGLPWQDCDTVRLEISVGQDYHEGAKLAATLDWAKARFEHVVVLVNDTLQRFDFMFEHGMTEPAALIDADHEGRAWIDRNAALLDGCRIHRWNEWLEQPASRSAIEQAETFCRDNSRFRGAIQAVIDSLWNRKAGKVAGYTEERRKDFENLSRRYLLEEIGAFSVIFRDIPGISVYPGSFHEMWSLFLDEDTPAALAGLKNGHYLRIDFRRNRSPVANENRTLIPPDESVTRSRLSELR